MPNQSINFKISLMDSLIMNLKGLLLTLHLLFCHSSLFATAGFAERINEFSKWISPAYYYFKLSMVISVIIFTTLLLINKDRIYQTICYICQYFRPYPSLAIITCGMPLAASLGIGASFIYLDNGIMSIFIIDAFLIIFLTFLSNRDFRNSIFLSPLFMILNTLLALSLVGASVLFILWCKSGWLEIRFGSECLAQPFFCLNNIWSGVDVFLLGILISLIFLFCGNLFRRITKIIKRNIRPLIR